jgi:hypothetical protein
VTQESRIDSVGKEGTMKTGDTVTPGHSRKKD